MPEIITFEDAIAETDPGSRHLLLGNGFSIACRPELFQYGALFDRAPNLISPEAMLGFSALQTSDFETVMRALNQTRTLVNRYEPDNQGLQDRLRSDTASIRQTLVGVIARNHPERVDQINDDEFRGCRRFLNQFSSIYTLNYDLLLYWAINKQGIDDLDLRKFDGFTRSWTTSGNNLIWDVGGTTPQNVFYLHGGLHLFDAGPYIRKLNFSSTGVPLIEQIMDALDQDLYPIYVAEGDSQSKMQKILSNAYLSYGFTNLFDMKGSLFVFGHSLRENDDHILRRIAENGIESLYVSIFGDPDDVINTRLIQSANQLATNRLLQRRRKWNESPELTVRIFDAESAEVWLPTARTVSQTSDNRSDPVQEIEAPF